MHFGVRSDTDDVTMAVEKVFTIKTEGGSKDFWAQEMKGKRQLIVAVPCSFV